MTSGPGFSAGVLDVNVVCRLSVSTVYHSTGSLLSVDSPTIDEQVLISVFTRECPPLLVLTHSTSINCLKMISTLVSAQQCSALSFNSFAFIPPFLLGS